MDKELRDDLNRRLTNLKCLIHSPGLFVSDHFFTIRNKIDLLVETRIYNNYKNDERKNNKPELDLQNGGALMIEELLKIEKEANYIVNNFDHENYSQILDSFQQSINSFPLNASNSIESEYSVLAEQINSQIEEIKFDLLTHKSILYKTNETNDLGWLIIFHDLLLTSFEQEILESDKNITTLNNYKPVDIFDKWLLEKSNQSVLQWKIDKPLRKFHLIAKYLNGFIANRPRPPQCSPCDFIVRFESNQDLDEQLFTKVDFHLADIIHNKFINRIDGNALSGLNNFTFSRLDLNDNRLTRIESNYFKGLNRLKSLDISKNQLEQLDHNCFSDLISLEYLNLGHNFLHRIDPGLFSSFSKSLRCLKLNSNVFKTASDSECIVKSLSILPNLTEIDLSSNMITNLDLNQLLLRLKHLKSFNLGMNFLEGLESSDNSPLSAIECLYLKSNRLAVLTARSFNSMMNLTLLNLASNSIRSIQARAFNYLRFLKNLDLQANLIECIDADTFVGLKNLNRLNLSMNLIRIVKRDSFKDLVNLSSLYLDENMIMNVEPGCFNGLESSLERLSLIDNHIDSLDSSPESSESIFDGLLNLKSLFLNDNKIVSIKMQHFKSLKNLIELNLMRNPIKHIEDQAFIQLVNLESSLIFQKFQLNKIKPDVFDGLKSVTRSFNLEYSNLECIEKFSFINLVSLRELKIENSRLSEIKANAFDCLPNLECLSLKNNSLTKLVSNLFKRLSKLQHLNLDNNNLRKIRSSNTFAGLISLKELSLSENQLSVLCRNVFDRLKSLDVLNLSRNRLENLDGRLFSSSSSELKALILSSNLLKHISATDFNNLSQLRSLNLCHNRLKSIDKLAFTKLVNLNKINLSKNLLEELPENLFKEQLNSLTEIQIEENFLRQLNFLNCHHEDGKKTAYLMYNSIQILNFSRNCLERLDANSFSSLEKLVELEISHSLVQTIEANTFSCLKNLRTLKLIGNHIGHISNWAFSMKSCNNNYEEDDESIDLVLENNFIESIDPAAFEGIECQKLFINFSKNFLRTNSIDFLLEKSSNFHRCLRSLDVSFNQFENFSNLNLNFDDQQQIQQLNLKANRLKQLHSISNEASTTSMIFNSAATRIDLSMNDLEAIPSKIFRNMGNHLKHLNLSSNQLSKLDKYAFDDLIHLEILNLKRNRLDCDRVDFYTLFRHLISLKFLDLQYNSISKPTNLMFNGCCASLHFLNLEGNGIMKLDDKQIFSNLKNLINLNLSNNMIDSNCVDAQIFQDLHRLEILDLSKNKLKDCDLFLKHGPFNSLKEIKLNDNQIEKIIGRRLLKNFKKLNKLHLRNNQIRNLEKSSTDREDEEDDDNYANSSQLEYLYLSNNKIETIDDGFFNKSFAKLHLLDISKNQLNGRLNSEAFLGLKKLARLDLSDNQLESVDNNDNRNPFEYLLNLFSLNLSKNKITAIEINSIDVLKDLSILDLSKNQLKSVDGIRNLRALESLNLASNHLSEINSQSLINDNLNKLDLSENKLELFRFDSIDKFNKMKSTEKLNLSSNHLLGTKIRLNKGFGSCSDIFLSCLDLSDCGLGCLSKDLFRPFVMLLELHLRKNNIKTLKSEYFKGLANLEIIDLAENQIESLQSNLFEYLDSLKCIDLSSNLLSVVNMNSFIILTQLEELNLSKNKCESCILPTSEPKWAIKRLNLSDNKLKSFQSIEQSLNNVARFTILNLDLSGNQMESVEFSSTELHSLETLDLSKNQLSRMANLHLFKRLKLLDLSGNRFIVLKQIGQSASVNHLSLTENLIEEIKLKDLNDVFPSLYLILFDKRIASDQKNDKFYKLRKLNDFIISDKSPIIDEAIDYCSSLIYKFNIKLTSSHLYLTDYFFKQLNI